MQISYFMNIKQIYIGHISTLFCGGLIYILFRSSSLKMFTWFKILHLDTFLQKTRNYTSLITYNLPDFILYSLPDGLWMFSYVSLVLYLWKNEVKYENLFWIFIIPLIAIISELGQLFNIICGTFDTIDLLLYILGMLLPFVIYKKSITINL